MHAKFQGIWGGIGGDMDQFKISSANLHPYNPNPNPKPKPKPKPNLLTSGS